MADREREQVRANPSQEGEGPFGQIFVHYEVSRRMSAELRAANASVAC